MKRAGQGLPHISSIGRSIAKGLAAMLVCTLAFASASAPAQAKVLHIRGRSYGVFLAPSAATGPFAQSPGPLGPGAAQPPLEYGGGPLMLRARIYAIFWGPKGSFAPSYENAITGYLKDLQTDRGKLTNDYSVATQYSDAGGAHITSDVTFVASLDDTSAYPAATGICTSDPNEGNPCVTDSQLRKEIARDIVDHSWSTDPPSAPVAEYLLFTPENVDSCEDGGSCTFSANGAFCGYHSEITNVNGGSDVAVYSNMPYMAGCDSGNAPPGALGNADADGSLDTLIHELGESATDPAAGSGYTDSNGLEVGDKCQNGAVDNGMPLGGSASASPPTLYNQLLNGHEFYTQTLWSNAAKKTSSSTGAAGCAQRLGPSPEFTAPEGVIAGNPQAFDGSASYDVAGAITSYSWNFGDGTTATGATVSHTFAAGGSFTVALTVSDAAGNATTERALVTVAPPDHAVLKVTRTGSGSGSVESSPSGIKCGSTCSATFSSGATVTLTATAEKGSTFTGFSGGGCSGTAPCKVTLSSDQTVTATFTSTVPQQTVTVTDAGSGAGIVESSPSGIKCGSTCSASFASGTKITLTATPAIGSTFTGFSGGGCSGTSPCVVTLSSSQAVTATFLAEGTSHILTVTKLGSGAVASTPSGISCGSTCSGTFSSGTSVKLTASPDPGFAFSGFTGGGCSGTGPCTVKVSSDLTVKATFTRAGIARLTVTKTGSGTVASSPGGISCGSTCTATFASGTSVKLTAVAAPGFTFAGFSGGGCSGTAPCTVKVSSELTVKASFTRTVARPPARSTARALLSTALFADLFARAVLRL